MRPFSAYRALLQDIVSKAEEMLRCAPLAHRGDGEAILEFIRQYGCLGCPVNDGTRDLVVFSWIARPGMPQTTQDAITIVPCFRGDDVPIKRPSEERMISPGCFNKSAQAIFLLDVEQWSLPELALTLLHEARHARHYAGMKLAGLPPLEVNNVHETNTWMVILNILTWWGGQLFVQAVNRELAWLKRQQLVSAHSNKIVIRESGEYWPELDRLFGPSLNLQVQLVRQFWVVLVAHMEYWPSQNQVLRPEDICHSIVSHYYKIKKSLKLARVYTGRAFLFLTHQPPGI